jgi:uncharacterized protein (DUF362 family)
MHKRTRDLINRKQFFGLLGAGGLGFLFPAKKLDAGIRPATIKPATNIADALKYPRMTDSMPGKYPGKVVRVQHENCILNEEPSEEAAYAMISTGMKRLTGTSDAKKAFKLFFNKNDRIGLKLNPVAGKSLSTSHAVVKALIRHLEESGVPRKNLMLWDRREFQLYECGFTEANYPGIKIKGTECKGSDDSFYGSDGKLLSEHRTDRDWFYWADVEGEYDEYTMPYMVNGGKYSYFTNILTKELDKVINVPIMKNAGSSITMAMKNLAYGAIGNTGRLHKDLWAETCAEVCAFPPLRDKVVLNIADGIKGCFNGGPAANPQFFTWYKTMLFSTDPVAIDRIGYEIVLKKRILEGLQTEDIPNSRNFMEIASGLGLGIADLEKIELVNVLM